MATSPAPVIERLTHFWHSHFACSSSKATAVNLLRYQHITFRRLGRGRFVDLLQAVAVSPATLIELDNAKNIAGREQENFARELMELYTLGNGIRVPSRPSRQRAQDAVWSAPAWSTQGGTTLDALRALLMRDEFWAPERGFAMVKAPIPWLAEIQRRTGAALSPQALDGRSGEMGQRLFEPPPVSGWGHNEFWTTPSRLLARAHAAKLGRFAIRDAGFLAGIETMDDAAAADFVLAKFGVPDAAPTTRVGMVSFLASARPRWHQQLPSRRRRAPGTSW